MADDSKLIEYLREAHTAEQASAERLAAVIERTGRADYRALLESHLAEEREHAARLERRLSELGFGESPIVTIVGLAESILTEAIGLVTAPLGLLRGGASEEDALQSAEELASEEALEVVVYVALERFAERMGDAETAKLAASIRVQEEKQLDLLRNEIPRLADLVLGGEAPAPATERAPAKPPRPKRTPARKRPATRRTPAQRRPFAAETSAPSHHPRTHSETAGPDSAEAGRIREAERGREEADSQEVSRDPDADPEGPGAELHVEEPWPGYDELSATEVAERVGGESEAVRAAVRLYEAAHQGRELVMRATSDDG
jgi:ferritin-like metal-binding protein YciE